MLDTLVKHTKHFTKPEHEKAKFINYYEDSSLFMCTGEIGLYAEQVHAEEAHVRNATNRKVKGDGVSQQHALRLIKVPEEVERDAAASCNVDVPELLAYVQGVNVANSLRENAKLIPLRFELNERGFTCEYDDDIEQVSASYEDDETSFEGQHRFLLNPNLLVHLLKLLAALGYDDVKFYFTSLMKPIEFRTYDGKLRLIILQMK